MLPTKTLPFTSMIIQIFDKDKFTADFSKINWHEESHSSNVSEKFFNFHNRVSNCIKHHVPLVKLSREKISLRSKPWINPRIEHLMAKRDKYLRKFNRTKSLDIEYLYKKFRNKIVSEIRKSKNDYYSLYFARHKSNMKMLWSGIRSIINVTSNVGISISSLDQNGVKVEEPKTMANIFNNVFVDTAHKINEKIPRTRKSPLDYLSCKNSDSFFVSPVSSAEIMIIINSITNGKAVGPYSIPIFLLKILSEHIAAP